MNSLQYAWKAFTKRPMPFVFSAASFIILIALAFMFFFGLDVLLLGVLNDAWAKYAAIGVSAFLFILFSTGCKGALIKGFYYGLEGKRVKIEEFLGLSIKSSLPLFLIGLFRVALLGVIALPIAGIYTIYKPEDMPWLYALLGVYFAAFGWIVSYLFSLSFISYVLGNGVVKSIKESFGLTIRKFGLFLPLYIVYTIVVLLGFIPLINIIVYFFLYPIAEGAIIYAYLSVAKAGVVVAEREKERKEVKKSPVKHIKKPRRRYHHRKK